MLRVIREVRPRWVVGENVLGLVNWNGGLVFHEVQSDLEAEGYEVQPFVLPAAAVGAPHRRDRVWFVAHAKESRGSISKLGKSEIRQQVQARCNIDRFEDMGDATNTDLHGCNERNGEHEEQSSQRGVDAQRDIEQSIKHGSAKHANSIRQEYALENGELEGRRFGKSDKRNAWDTFPSVSPICGGNDGISDRLDGITFSKWRQESVKAYGNAVVPALVYQIFKAIQEYENKYL